MLCTLDQNTWESRLNPEISTVIGSAFDPVLYVSPEDFDCVDVEHYSKEDKGRMCAYPLGLSILACALDTHVSVAWPITIPGRSSLEGMPIFSLISYIMNDQINVRKMPKSYSAEIVDLVAQMTQRKLENRPILERVLEVVQKQNMASSCELCSFYFYENPCFYQAISEKRQITAICKYFPKFREICYTVLLCDFRNEKESQGNADVCYLPSELWVVILAEFFLYSQ